MKDSVDAGDYFYYKRECEFDAMPACWKNLEEDQRRAVATLIDSFYDESRADYTKETWAIGNIKKYLDLEFVTLVDLPKFRAAYLATLGDDSVFADPPLHNAVIKEAGNMKLLGDHDGFALKPKKLMKKYKDNPVKSKVQGKVFIHMNNFSASEHVANEKKLGRVVDLSS